MTEGENVDLEAIHYEAGMPLDRVHTYNAFTVLSKLEFGREESVDPNSQSTKYLDELAKSESTVEDIIAKLIAYREEIVNYEKA